MSARLVATRWGVVCSGTWNLEPVLVCPRNFWRHGHMAIPQCHISYVAFHSFPFLVWEQACISVPWDGWSARMWTKYAALCPALFWDPGYVCLSLWVYELVFRAWWQLLLRAYGVICEVDWYCHVIDGHSQPMESFPAIGWHISK